MYEALKPFKMPTASGQVVSLQAGDLVEGFEDLPYGYQQAAISTHQVRVRPADASVAARRLEPSHEEVREQKNAALVAAAAKATAQAGEPTLQCGLCEFETRSIPGLKAHKTRMHGAS